MSAEELPAGVDVALALAERVDALVSDQPLDDLLAELEQERGQALRHTVVPDPVMLRQYADAAELLRALKVCRLTVQPIMLRLQADTRGVVRQDLLP